MDLSKNNNNNNDDEDDDDDNDDDGRYDHVLEVPSEVEHLLPPPPLQHHHLGYHHPAHHQGQHQQHHPNHLHPPGGVVPPPPPPPSLYGYPNYAPYAPPPPPPPHHHHHHHHHHPSPHRSNYPNYPGYPSLPPHPPLAHYGYQYDRRAGAVYRYPPEQPPPPPPPPPHARDLTTPPPAAEYRERRYPPAAPTTTEEEAEEEEGGGFVPPVLIIERRGELPEASSRHPERRRQEEEEAGMDDDVDAEERPPPVDDDDDDDDDDERMGPMPGEPEHPPPPLPTTGFEAGGEEEEEDAHHRAGGKAAADPATAAAAAPGGDEAAVGRHPASAAEEEEEEEAGSAEATDARDCADGEGAAARSPGRSAPPPADGRGHHPADDAFPFGSALAPLEAYRSEHGTLSVPTSHPAFAAIVDALVEGGIEDAVDAAWERNFASLREYRERAGDCDVPFAGGTGLGSWVAGQRRLHARLLRRHPGGDVEEGTTGGRKDGGERISEGMRQPMKQQHTAAINDKIYSGRFERLSGLGFDFTTPLWDVRLRELIEYKAANGHCSPPITYPKLGIWVVNQRFNLKNMPRERVAALDSLGFVWNHNRKRSGNTKWDGRYDELCEYHRQNGHCNVPATYRHSPLGTWVGKQREEYKKLQAKKSSQLDKSRIDRLNEIGFQWSLQKYTITSWDDRYQALVDFKEKHGHVQIPRNHPVFGNWPVYQKAQYKLFKDGKKSKLTEDKVEKLIRIGFLTPFPLAQVVETMATEDGERYDS